MFNKIKDLKKDEFIRGSFVLFIMVNAFNFLNYIFHFSMARMLVPADYGILAVLMSVAYIFTVPSEAIQTIITRYTARLNIKKKYGEIKDLLGRSLKKGLKIASMIFVLFLFFSPFLSLFLKINFLLFAVTGSLVFCFFLLPIGRGILQGQKKFIALGTNMIIEGFLKVFLAIFLVFLGFGVFGAIGAVIFGAFTAFFLTFIPIKKIIKSKRKRTSVKGIFSYSFPVFLVVLSVILMYSLDIIFAKRFFSPDIAGKYAVASMLGRMIFFATFAISKAMFPITSESFDRGGETKKLFGKAFFLVTGICIIVLIIYWLFPKLIISILFGKQYIEIANILIFVGLALSFVSLTNLSLLYAISIHKKNTSFFFIFVFVEILFFIFLHKSLLEFSIGFMIANFIMFLASLIFIKR